LNRIRNLPTRQRQRVKGTITVPIKELIRIGTTRAEVVFQRFTAIVSGVKPTLSNVSNSGFKRRDIISSQCVGIIVNHAVRTDQTVLVCSLSEVCLGWVLVVTLPLFADTTSILHILLL
jgi:hypothetical protein